MRQNLMKLKGEKDKSRTIVEYISTFLFAVARTSRQEVSKDIGDLKNTTNQLHLADISRAFYPIISPEYRDCFYLDWFIKICTLRSRQHYAVCRQ